MWTHQSDGGAKSGQMHLEDTLSSCVYQAVKDGYTECFNVTSRGLYAISKSRYYRPEQVRLVNTCHCEGATTAGGNTNGDSDVYVIETSDGVKGTLVDTGSYADGSVGRFMGESEAIRNKVNRHNQHEC